MLVPFGEIVKKDGIHAEQTRIPLRAPPDIATTGHNISRPPNPVS